ncbi:MAG: hypothetical protein ABIK09_14700 [Pseudomonadota bacterium]
MHRFVPLILVASCWLGCGSAAPDTDTVTGTDTPAEVASDLTPDVPPTTTPGGLPFALSFSYERPDVGEPVTPEEITAFTKRITGLWKKTDYFTWVYETSHGVDASTGYPDYLIWWHDVDAVKEGDTVTFMNQPAYGGSHNNAEPTNLVLVQAIGAYLATGDSAAGEIVEQFAKSNTALMKGFVYDVDDPVDTVMARNIVTFNHEFTLPSGKKKAVDYDDWYFSYEGWNADRFHYPDNPTWGDLWVTTQRSKDDVPYIYRAAAWLPYVIELAPDDEVRDAAIEMLDFMQRFARDVAEHDWNIRTRDAEGNAFVLVETGKDLLDLAGYVDLFPDAECDARLATALLGYGEALDVDCGAGWGSMYDEFAGSINYFNYQIIDHYHVAALHLALTLAQEDVAEALLIGLGERLDHYQDPAADVKGREDENWDRDLSLVALKGASLGLPLTSREVRLIHALHDGAVTRYSVFPNWDLWDDSVADGAYSFRDGFHPKAGPDAVRPEEMAFFMEYCWSPFRNPAGRAVVDCDVVNDPSRWGE